MKARSLRLLALCSVPFVGACADDGVGPQGPSVELEVAPLSLPGIGYACYDVKVYNAAGGPTGGGQLVWGKGDTANQGANDADAICSDDFGNGAGGDIAYVGPCDADGEANDGDAAGEKMNSITLWFDGLYESGGTYISPTGPNGWVDPCPNGCTLNVLCEENADNLVLFNFTVMRDASQGFFDIAVNFADIFCSAKSESCYTDANGVADPSAPINLLHGPDAGDPREHTAITALACTVGPDAGTDIATKLLLTTPTVTCDQATFPLNLTGAGQGNGSVTVVGAGSVSYTLNYALYYGNEALDCSGTAGSCNKVYYNLAINIADLAADGLDNCKLSYTATAVEAADTTTFVAGALDDDAAQYAAISFGTQAGQPINLTDTAASLCYSHQLSATGPVQPTYVKGADFGGSGITFNHATTGGAATVP